MYVVGCVITKVMIKITVYQCKRLKIGYVNVLNYTHKHCTDLNALTYVQWYQIF